MTTLKYQFERIFAFFPMTFFLFFTLVDSFRRNGDEDAYVLFIEVFCIAIILIDVCYFYRRLISFEGKGSEKVRRNWIFAFYIGHVFVIPVFWLVHLRYLPKSE